MQIYSRLLALFFIATSLFAQAAEPSSLIPERRDFPLSSQVNPCDDFHKYVCSEAEAGFKLRADRSRHDFSFSDSFERILDAKKRFFAGIQTEKRLSARAHQIKSIYLACMNPKTGQSQEKERLAKIQEQLKGMKKAEQFADGNLANIRSGLDTLYSFDISSNQDNPLVYDLVLMTELMNLPEHTYYDNKELMAEYRQLIIDYFKIIEPKLDSKALESRADRLLNLEKEFVKIYPHPEVRRQRWSENRQEKKADFLKKYPRLHFERIFEGTPENILVTNPLPEALEFLNSKMSDENLEALKDFFNYSYGRSYLDDGNSEYFNKQFAFKNKYLGGPPKRSERDERCTQQVMWHFGKELDEIMTERLFPHFPEEKLRSVATKIRESIVSGLQKNTWLEPQTKAKAILKMTTAKLFLIKPQNDKEWDFLPIARYSSKNRIDNWQLLAKVLFQKKMADVRKEVNLEAWGMGPLTVNAYYDPSANKFVMPIGILQYPFFNTEGDLIENIGAVGAVIGHELGHGIDDAGSKYDEDGKLKQWMTMKDLAEFSKRAGKMVTQFDKAGHNGKLTLGENIGDLVGLTFAYGAAFPDGKGSKEQQQKLFVAYARIWCAVALPKADEQQLKTDPHALGWARINEQVKNQPAFATAFNCKKGDKMTIPAEDRVSIW